MKVYTAGLIDKPLRSINRDLGKKITSDLRKKLKVPSKAVASKEINTFIVASAHKGLTSEFDTNLFDEIEEGVISKRLKEYYNNNESRFKNYLKNNLELRETSHIVKNFIKEIDSSLLKKFDDQLIQEIGNDLPKTLCELSTKSLIAVWQIEEHQAYRLYLSGTYYPAFMGKTSETPMNAESLVDKLLIVNFFAIFLRPTLALLEKMHRVLDQLEREVDKQIYRIDDKKLQSKLELFLRILLAKLNALQELDNLIYRIFHLFETPHMLLTHYNFTGRFIDFNTILSRISEEIQVGKSKLQEVSAKIHHCQLCLRDYLDKQINGDTTDDPTQLVKEADMILSKLTKEIHTGNPNLQEISAKIHSSQVRLQDYLEKQAKGDKITDSLQEFKTAMKPLAELSIDLFVEAELLKIWLDFFGSDIPYFNFNFRLFDTVDTKTVKIDPDIILAARGLLKNYNLGRTTVYALRGVDLDIREGEFVAILGNSGAGKTTLLNCMASLDTPDQGTVYFRGKDLSKMKDGRKSRARLLEMGFIFQNYALIPHFNTRENVALPADLAGLSKELKMRIEALLEGVGIDQQAEQFPAQLSGGQMQRVAIARALTNRPAVIFADEPTGDLDSVTGRQVMDLLKKFHEETKTTIIVITHEQDIADYAERQIVMEDGVIIR
ncbi:MAG: ABC transporter ATP-binding protein [Candidatus Odinarchaeota archaeon]